MATTTGSLRITNVANPASAPAYSVPTEDYHWVFSDAIIVFYAYRAKRELIRHLVPDILELEEEPVVVTMFNKFDASEVGPYTELQQMVEATYKGVKYNYCLGLLLNNEAAVFSGREMYGLPKKFGQVEIKPEMLAGGPGGFAKVHGNAAGMDGSRLVEFEFTPKAKADLQLPTENKLLGLRIIPNPMKGATKPQFAQLIPLPMNVTYDALYTGEGKITFLKGADSGSFYGGAVTTYDGIVLATNVTTSLAPLEEVFDIC